MANQAVGARLNGRREKMTTKTLKQTVLFKGTSPEELYDLIMVSRKHASLAGEKP
jgi:hypothetical protein